MLELKKDSITEHAHHWLIEEVAGPTSLGRCLSCNEIREFRNSPADSVLQRAEYAA